MAFDWVDYLKLAKGLLGVTNEAALRSSISRAYYFVYHVARNRLESNGLTPNWSDSQHKITWEYYEGSPDYECKKLGLLGQRLRSRRTKADYDLVYGGRVEEEAPDSVTKAEEFAVSLGKIDERLPRVG